MPLGQPPETAKEALKEWDSNQPVISVEMGGTFLGPSYEQTIHIAVFELLRLCLKNRPHLEDAKKLSEVMDKYLSVIDKTKELQMSAAQAGAAKHLAYCYLVAGYKQTVDSHRNLRRIQVMRWFPRA